LGIKEGTDDWLTFFDLAAADLGQLPEDLKGDERLLKSLPLLFRTVRAGELSEEELKKLIEALRKSPLRQKRQRGAARRRWAATSGVRH